MNMAPPTLQNELLEFEPLWNNIMELEEKIDKTRWYEFFKRMELRYLVSEIRHHLFLMGLNRGIDDLKEMGIITVKKNDE